MNVHSRNKWWSTLKSVVFGSSSSLPPLVGMVDLLSDQFDRKQSRKSVDLLLTWLPSLNLTTFAFRSSEVRRLLLYLDPYGGTDPLGMFPLFLKRTAYVMLVFRQLVRLGSFRAPTTRFLLRQSTGKLHLIILNMLKFLTSICAAAVANEWPEPKCVAGMVVRSGRCCRYGSRVKAGRDYAHFFVRRISGIMKY